jgi:hypothetical protein
MKNKQLLILILIMVIATFLLAQETVQQAQPRQRSSTQQILQEDQVFEGEIEVRVPEQALLPRKRTDEIKFSLSFIRQQFMESNRSLY